jgi:hypothetical protein
LTASQLVQPDQSRSAGGTAAAVAIGVIATVAVLGLFVAGVTFLGLAIAFPIVGPVVSQYHLVVSAADLALAERLAGFWWLFGVLAVASVGAAVVVAVKAIERLSPSPRD